MSKRTGSRTGREAKRRRSRHERRYSEAVLARACCINRAMERGYNDRNVVAVECPCHGWIFMMHPAWIPSPDDKTDVTAMVAAAYERAQSAGLVNDIRDTDIKLTFAR